MRPALIPVVLATAVLCSFEAKAATITRTYDITASNFYQDGLGYPSGSPPYSKASEVITVTFDDSKVNLETSQGLKIDTGTLPFSAEYEYDPVDDLLTFATDPHGYYIGEGFSQAYGFATLVSGATSASPTDTFFSYTPSLLGLIYVADTVNVSVSSPLVSAAPEPSTWLLMMAGIGGIGFMMRRNKREGGSLAGAAVN